MPFPAEPEVSTSPRARPLRPLITHSRQSPQSSTPLRYGLHLPMEEPIVVEGQIVTVLAGTMFRVQLPNKHQVLATIAGRMRKRFVRLTPGDRVRMEMSPYDLNKARIVWRLG
jgi:translation initiation factor IF-1